MFILLKVYSKFGEKIMDNNDKVVFDVRYQLFDKIVDDTVLKSELTSLLINNKITILNLALRDKQSNEVSLGTLSEGTQFYWHGKRFTLILRDGENIYAQEHVTTLVHTISSTILVNI